MKLRKGFIIGILALIGSLPSLGATGLKISGKIRVLSPTTIELKTLDGKTILKGNIDRTGKFEVISGTFTPDVYILYIGNTRQEVFLKNKEVTINGFYNENNPKDSSLSFGGIDEFLKISGLLPARDNKDIINPKAKESLKEDEYAALAYFADYTTYKPNKTILDWIPGNARNSQSAKWLIHKVDSLERFSEGAIAPGFTFVDPNGKMISLKDFRGKLVLIDFWASWCGPCRKEMKNLLPIYQELKGDDLEFISISLDSKEADWRKMLDTEQLPWVMLWNKEGFTVGDKPNNIQSAYGFYSIPFIVLIDKEGKILERRLRGEKVKEAILRARNQK